MNIETLGEQVDRLENLAEGLNIPLRPSTIHIEQLKKILPEIAEVKKILKNKGRLELYTDERYEQIKAVMKYGITKDEWLNNYLSLDPINKAQWCADHLIKLVEGGNIK